MINLTNDGSDLYRLPNALREAMLQAGHGKSLVVLEGLYHLAFKAETWLTFDQTYRLCRDNFGMSYQLVYHGLRNAIVFQRRKAQGVAHKRGARPYLYRLPHPDELMAEWDVRQKHSPHDELQKADFKSVTVYRRALHRQLFIRKWVDSRGKGFVMSRKLMAKRLGVSVRTVRTYDRQLGHSNDPNYKEIDITRDNWFKLPRYKDKFDARGNRLPSKVWLRTYQHDTHRYRNLPCVRYLAYQALQQGQAVCLVERLPNTYYPYQKPDLSQFESWDAHAHYFAELDARHAAGFYQRNDGSWYYQRE